MARLGPLASLLLALLLPASLAAQTPGPGAADGFAPLETPTLAVGPAEGPIAVDGDLGDAGWRNAARATGFSENFPRERGRPPVETEAWVTYDRERLYVAILSSDDPSTIRTSLRDRDQVWQDDYACVFLDTYGDGAWAYTICANASGVQLDTRIATASGEDDGFDIVYASEARITDRGWQLEIAIPFGSLRFPNRAEQTWRATFWRTRPRESRAQYTWAAMRRDDPCFICQFGTLTGIRGVEPGGALELLPAAVASHVAALDDDDDPAAGLGDGEFDAEASLTARYAHPSGVTVEATVNPDFSQVESDVAQIDANTTFALFFPERRPFFQEGSDLFQSYFTVLYTRQINDPTAAAKVIGRMGRTSLAYLGARDEHSPILIPFQDRSFLDVGGASVSNVLRARRTYGESSYAGAILTDRRFEEGGGAGTTAGVDGVHRFLDAWRLEYQALGSRTVEPDEAGPTADLGDATFDGGARTAAFDGEEFGGWGGYASLERSGRHWVSDVDVWVASPTFRADTGFETRNDFRNLAAFEEFNWYPDTWLDRFTVDARMNRLWTYGGDVRETYFTPTIEMQLKAQTFVEIGHTWGAETFRGVELDGLARWFALVDANFSERVGGGVYVQRGDQIARNLDVPAVGTETFVEVWSTIKPIDRLTIEPSYRWSRLVVAGDEVFEGAIVRARSTLNFSRRLFARVVVQYDEFDERIDVEPLVTYRIDPFTLFYVGSTNAFQRFDDERDDEFLRTSRQYFAKIQYMFRL